jgi:hypothetical protein
LVPVLVVSHLGGLLMNTPVELYDETQAVATEVRNKIGDRELSTELEPPEPAVTE